MFLFKIYFTLLFILLSLTSVWADGEHYKNSLIGGRAGTMGGAYVAISDDASGSFYNPSGLVYATGGSISGSTNTYSISKATYKHAIDAQDWKRDSKNLLPNFFGLVKKFKKYSFGFSYVVRDSFIEHQDQVYRGLTGVDDPIDVYVLNIHTEDNSYQLGPSLAKKINSKLSIGITTYYHYRIFRRSQSQLIEYSDDTDMSSYLNTLKKEKGIYTKLGAMWTPKDKWSLGLTIAKTSIITSFMENQNNIEAKSSSNNGFLSTSDLKKRKLPWETSLGVAYFSSPYDVFSLDFDYFIATDSNKKNVWNISFGGEHFFNETKAIRYGFFTNRTNNLDITNEPIPRRENINFYGATIGYAIYTKDTTLTFGTIYSQGSGKSQIYTEKTTPRDLDKYTLNFVVSADYGF